MINLYIFNESSRAAVYGIGTFIRELTEALKDSEINACVVHLRSNNMEMENEELDGIRHLHIPPPINWNTSMDWNRQSEIYYRNVVYLLRLQIKNADRLVFHLNFMQGHTLAEELRIVFSCKIILTVHYLNWCFSLSGNTIRFRNLLAQPKDSLNEPIVKKEFQTEKEFLGIVDKIICLSGYTRNILQTDYGIESNLLHVVYNGLSGNDTLVNIESLHKKYWKLIDTPVVLFVGRLDAIKGLKYLLRAFKIVLHTLPHCRMVIAGNGSYNSCLKECEDIWMNVTFTGLIDKTKLYDLYSIVDIGIMPSFHEQCSYVAIEMMMHGLPIIASTSTGLKEMVEDGVTGLHIPVTEYPDKAEIDSSLLADKMLYLLQNPDEREQMGINARRRYESVYSSEIFRRNMLDFYQSLFQ